MIVKNETPVIRRCLDSLKGLIDCWVIVDTGSTDGTQAMIREQMADIPGQVIERPWVDFEHNRSEALALARGKADFVLIIDADEMLELDPGFAWPELSADAYLFEMRSGGIAYYKVQLVRDALDWSYKSVLHEYIYCEGPRIETRMQGLRTLRFPDGARARDPLTYRKDAVVLEGALLSEPDNSRYMFYLAQSYRDAGEPLLAIDRYEKRAAMGGWIEEVWYSLYQIASLKKASGAPWAEVSEAYLRAFQAKPDRAEPLYQIGFHHQGKREFALADLYFQRALAIPFPVDDQLFVEKAIYDSLLPLEAAVAAYYCGDHAAAIDINNRLLASPDTPPGLIDQVIRNRQFSLDVLNPRQGAPPTAANRIRVCVPFTDAGPHLDNCVESLMVQEGADFTAVFYDNGSSRDHSAKIPLEDPRFRLMRADAPITVGDALRQSAAGAEPNEILFLLEGANWLAEVDTLARVDRFFNAYGCAAMYGQYRYSNGVLGLAMPFASPDDMEGRPPMSVQPLAVRAKVLDELLEGEVSPLALLRQAGLSRSRFNDDVLVVWNLEA